MKKYFYLAGKVCLRLLIFLFLIGLCIFFLKFNRRFLFQEFTKDYSKIKDTTQTEEVLQLQDLEQTEDSLKTRDFLKIDETENLEIQSITNECKEKNENDFFCADFINEVPKKENNSFTSEFYYENKSQIQKRKKDFPEKVILKQEKTKNGEKSTDTNSISENTNIDFPNLQKDSEQSDLGFYYLETDGRQKKIINVNAGVGIVPIFFARGSFFLDYFNQQFFLAPCGTLKFVFSQINQYYFAISLDAVFTYLDFFAENYIKNINLGLSSFFYLTQVNFSASRYIFNQNNLLELHFGSGIAFFEKLRCKINDSSFSNFKSFNFTLNFGLSFNHYFTENFFSSFLINCTYCIPSVNKIFLVQPGFIFGMKF